MTLTKEETLLQELETALPGSICTIERGPHQGAWVKIAPKYIAELEGAWCCIGTGRIAHYSWLAAYPEWTTVQKASVRV